MSLIYSGLGINEQICSEMGTNLIYCSHFDFFTKYNLINQFSLSQNVNIYVNINTTSEVRTWMNYIRGRKS